MINTTERAISLPNEQGAPGSEQQIVTPAGVKSTKPVIFLLAFMSDKNARLAGGIRYGRGATITVGHAFDLYRGVTPTPLGGGEGYLSPPSRGGGSTHLKKKNPNGGEYR